MFSQLFGKYLVGKEIISESDLEKVWKDQQSARVKLGTIAVSEGMLTVEEADEINHIQTHEDKRFGDIAVEKGFLTADQVDEILSKQGNPFMKFLQILDDQGRVSMQDLEALLKEYQIEHGFSDHEMVAMKNENIDEICSMYAYAAKPYVTEITSLVLRNLTRFVTGNFYIDKIQKVDTFAYQCFVGQKIVGDHTIYVAFGDDGGEGAVTLASDFAKEDFAEMGPLVYDAIGEFSNICSGLFSSDVSKKGINIDMEPPFVYVNQSAQGSAYVVPIHLDGKVIQLYVAVDSEVSLGTQRHMVKIEKSAGSQVTAESKGTVVIVDDSALIRKMLRGIVEDYGYTVVAEAVNGQEAVEEYKAYHPDLITLDITMPVMDGLEALEQIMDYDDEAKAIMITAAGQQQKVIDALKTGASHFIMKPFNKDEVIASFDGVLGN